MGHPLTLKCDSALHNSSTVNHFLKQHLLQVRALTLCWDSLSYFRRTLEGITDLPQLETLVLDGEDLWSRRFARLESPLEELIAPRLQVLSISNVRITAHHLLSDLTVLELTNRTVVDPETTLPSLNDILSILARSPRLSILKLHRYWTDSVDSQSIARPSIRLDNLLIFDFATSASHMCIFFLAIQMPPTVSLCLMLHEENGDATSCRNPMNILRQHLFRLGGLVFRSCTLEQRSSRNLMLRASTRDVPPSVSDFPARSYNPEERGQLTISMNASQSSQRALRSIIKKIIRAIPFDTSSVHMRAHTEGMTSTTWKAIGMALPQLKTLDIGVNEMVNILEGMMLIFESGKCGVFGSGRRRTARTATLHPTVTVLSLHSRFLRGPVSPDIRHKWFQFLLHFMKRYRDNAYIGKPPGELWDVLQFPEETEDVRTYRDILSDMVRTLIIGGKVYRREVKTTQLEDRSVVGGFET